MPYLFALFLVIVAASTIVVQPSAAAQEPPKTYPQLISTRYASGAPLPADFKRPDAAYDFVERAKLPPDARILSAAKGKNGVVWIVGSHSLKY